MATEASEGVITIVPMGNLPRNTNLLPRVLFKDRAKVLFVGEGDFTFTVAFAAYREQHYGSSPSLGAWEGITSTRYNPVGPEDKFQCVGNTPVQCKPAPTLSADSYLINYLPSVPAGTWLCGIDATALPTILTQSQQVIWFQCPWVARNNSNYSTAELVSDFLLNMAAQIQPGVHVCVGIANYCRYVTCYGLDKILGPNLESLPNSTPVLEQYEFAGADDQLVSKLLEFEYMHQSVGRDIHKLISRSHVTLIFTKKEELSVIPVDDLHYYHSGKVLFVGDRDFTFTVALTAYRQSKKLSHKPWEGITSTRYEPAGPEGEVQYVGETSVQCKPPPILSEVKLQCIASSRNNDVKTIMLINGLPSVPAGTWLYGIDSIAPPTKLTRDQQVIWFQCPGEQLLNIGTLVTQFLLNMAAQIQPGVHVCVGITKHPVKKYNLAAIDLEDILGDHLAVFDNSTLILEKYQFIGADGQLIKKLIEFGYTHEYDYDVTLIFKRKNFMRKNPCDLLPIYHYTDSHTYDNSILQRKTLFVGDSTLTVAFVARRYANPWEGITSTRYEPDGSEGEVRYVEGTLVQCKPPLILSEVKLQCIASYAEDYLKTYGNLQDVKKCIIDLPDAPAGTWLYGIDPLALRPALINGHDLIWFHCPWTSVKESSLLLQFLQYLHQHIRPGTCVHMCISIVRSYPFINYFFESFQSVHTTGSLCVASCELIELLFGYIPTIIQQDRIVLVWTNCVLK